MQFFFCASAETESSEPDTQETAQTSKLRGDDEDYVMSSTIICREIVRSGSDWTKTDPIS